MCFVRETARSAVSRFNMEVNGKMVSINGEKVNADGMSISEYLANTSYDLKKIAIERNEAIVPKAKYDETVLCDGDSVEIVNFVGGG